MIFVLELFRKLYTRRKPVRVDSLLRILDQSDNHTVNRYVKEDFKEDFYLNLQRTIVWTQTIINQIEDTIQINYAKVLRTVNPVYEGRSFYVYDEQERYPETIAIGFDYKSILKNVLNERKGTVLPKAPVHKLGRILIFEIDLTTHDGVAVIESNGFVDGSDIPPVDTWFYIKMQFLYCWIPAMFVDKMQAAIDVEIMGSYNWLDEVDPEANERIFMWLSSNDIDDLTN